MVSVLQRSVATLLLLLVTLLPAWAGPPIPALTGRVVDLAHILDAPTTAALTRKLAEHEARTSNQVVVVTLPDLQDYTVEQWGLALLNGWGIGQRNKNNGVVLLVAPNERRLRIEVGYGLESRLSNQAAADIIQNEIIPRFKGGDLKGGVTAGVDAILETIAGTYRPPLIDAGGGLTGLAKYLPFIGIPLLFFVIVGINIFLGSSPARRAGSYYRNRYDDDRWSRRDRWEPRSSSSGGGFSGGGGSGGGGGASGRW